MKLIAVRHGETEWNLQRREMGHLDCPLTERGIQQAKALAARLSTLSIDAFYSSDLGRAVQTASIIGGACERPVRLDAGLRERHMGLFQGLTWEEIGARFPDYRRAYDETGFFEIVPEGETAQDRVDRSARVLTGIAERHPRETVAVVTHGGFLMGFLEFVLGIEVGAGARRFKKQHASFNAFEYVNGHWCLETWNDSGHLNGFSALDGATNAGYTRLHQTAAVRT